jgi:hypothetical protein
MRELRMCKEREMRKERAEKKGYKTEIMRLKKKY